MKQCAMRGNATLNGFKIKSVKSKNNKMCPY